jgi:hypothetical protein
MTEEANATPRRTLSPPVVIIGTFMAAWNLAVFSIAPLGGYKLAAFVLVEILVYPLVKLALWRVAASILLYVSMMLLFVLVVFEFDLSPFRNGQEQWIFSLIAPFSAIFAVNIAFLGIAHFWHKRRFRGDTGGWKHPTGVRASRS